MYCHLGRIDWSGGNGTRAVVLRLIVISTLPWALVLLESLVLLTIKKAIWKFGRESLNGRISLDVEHRYRLGLARTRVGT